MGEIYSKESFRVETNQPWSWHRIMKTASVIYGHVCGQWNTLDCITIICWLLWAICLLGLKDPVVARLWKALSAMPLTFGLVRYVSTTKIVGHLVITVFELMRDLLSVVAVFSTYVLGFAITFYGLFAAEVDVDVKSSSVQDNPFNSFLSTMLLLFEAAVGNHEFNSVIGKTHETVGIFLLGSFVIFASMLLTNVIATRISSAHERKGEDVFLEEW